LERYVIRYNRSALALLSIVDLARGAQHDSEVVHKRPHIPRRVLLLPAPSRRRGGACCVRESAVRAQGGAVGTGRAGNGRPSRAERGGGFRMMVVILTPYIVSFVVGLSRVLHCVIKSADMSRVQAVR